MSSINSHPTFVYSQPDEYRTSHDSIFFARYVFEQWKLNPLADAKILDVCAGAGVVGLDFLYHCQDEKIFMPKCCDFIEVQETYKKHFDENVQRANLKNIELHFRQMNYIELLKSPSENYDLIVANPPYFRPGQGKLSRSELKNRSRFFIDSDFPHFIEALQYSLSLSGQAFILMRDLGDHGWNPFEEAKVLLKGKRSVEKVATIRGTDVVSVRGF